MPLKLFRYIGTPVLSWTIESKNELEVINDRCTNYIFEGFYPNC